MKEIITKHKNKYKVFQLLPIYNVHLYFFLKNLGKKMHIIHGKIQYF